jgi:hypothetical protein
VNPGALSANASKLGFISSWRGNSFSITSPFNVYGLIAYLYQEEYYIIKIKKLPS